MENEKIASLKQELKTLIQNYGRPIKNGEDDWAWEVDFSNVITKEHRIIVLDHICQSEKTLHGPNGLELSTMHPIGAIVRKIAFGDGSVLLGDCGLFGVDIFLLSWEAASPVGWSLPSEDIILLDFFESAKLVGEELMLTRIIAMVRYWAHLDEIYRQEQKLIDEEGLSF